MTIKTTQNDKDVFLAQWIEGDISDSRLKTLVSEEDYKAFKIMRQGINAYVEIEKPLHNTFNEIKVKIKTKSGKKPKAKIINLYSKVAVAIAASVILFYSLNTFFDNNDVNFQSNFGELQVVTLLDGSEVILNAKSELKYNKKEWKINREVFLNGEAFFKVQKGKTFKVTTTNGSITVLGTQFNVNNQTNFFEVICYQGKVKVVNNNKDYILTPNKSIRNSKGITTENTLELTSDKPTWTYGESNFRSVPLSQVLNALEKQFNIQFYSTNIDDSVIFTGSFDNKNLDLALASVFKTVQVQYKIEGQKVILSK
jgi:transmembrane sensor